MTGIGGSTAAAELNTLQLWASPAPAITREERIARIDRARTLMAQTGADMLIVGAGASLRYFAGLAWGATERLVAMLLPIAGDPIFICPAFELGSFEAGIGIDGDVRLWEEDARPSALVADALRAANATTLAIDPALAFLFVDRIRRDAPHVALVDGGPVIDGCRMVKSPAELALLSQAKAMTLEVHRRTARILHEGIRASEVIRFIDAAHRALGSTGSTFCAVQFGRSTAFPHGLPQDDILRDGDLVLVDTGCLADGYHSDITRTYAFGDVGDEIRAIWNIEHEAQAAAFDAVRPGAPCEAIDAAARRVLERAGLGPNYRLPGLPHRTGHGIGLSIHEPAYLVRGDTTPLAPGMCFSNEPMIVVPDRFGVRLEDHFHVTETGAAWFTPPQPAIDDLG
ncbi:Xaa-Pro peptidase family protein [uncultured Sphingomonas sp.]|uniref:M24 family metallopeptidase n=1 Tax=uncultured Sphingomonas sp. TaxID=158754 RepID=UPI002631A7DB|nr:Xaa-Pro peptidase family protein [uncultured Sphingomonas sp.]